MQELSVTSMAVLGFSTLIIIFANTITGIVARKHSTIMLVCFLGACIYVIFDDLFKGERPWLLFIFQGPFNIFQIPFLELVSLIAAVIINFVAGLALAYAARGITFLIRRARNVKT